MCKFEWLPCTLYVNISSTRYYVNKPYLHSFINVCLTRKSVLNVHWKDWCWSWNSNTCIRKSKKQKVMLSRLVLTFLPYHCVFRVETAEGMGKSRSSNFKSCRFPTRPLHLFLQQHNVGQTIVLIHNCGLIENQNQSCENRKGLQCSEKDSLLRRNFSFP